MSFLSDRLAKSRTVAPSSYNRWLVPPAALCIHLCIGMAYGFSVFWLPLSQAIGISKPVACAADIGFLESITTQNCDWKISMLGWMYTLFFVFLGSSAAIWGGWLEREGPRKAGFVSALCWAGGLVISAGGVYWHQLWMLWLGSGVIGGIGLGLGYISPVSTLIKWFPDRRGMATGMAIMGFGGGAMIGAPLADRLMKLFATPNSVGVWETFLVMAGIYFLFMMGGAFGYRLPVEGWTPPGMPIAKSSLTAGGMVTANQVHLSKAWRTPQFWCLWGVLCLNVTAGIGILGIASPMLQEIFAGKLIGVDLAFRDLNAEQKAQIAAIAAGFTGLLSLLNIAGRFIWASLSDLMGRKTTYLIFFSLGFLLYSAAPSAAKAGNVALFVGLFCIILSMYGGGFATIPAYLSDMFGTRMVGAIHGRLLTAWSVAGVFGPVIVNYLREYQLGHGVEQAAVYNTTAYVLAALLVLGFICNWLVKPVHPKHHMTEEELASTAAPMAAKPAEAAGPSAEPSRVVATVVAVERRPLLLTGAWLAAGVPLGWGIFITVQKAWVLFR